MHAHICMYVCVYRYTRDKLHAAAKKGLRKQDFQVTLY
jgi:hypothetical protein